MLERKSMATYSAMSVFRSKSGKWKGGGEAGHGLSRNKSDDMDLERGVST